MTFPLSPVFVPYSRPAPTASLLVNNRYSGSIPLPTLSAGRKLLVVAGSGETSDFTSMSLLYPDGITTAAFSKATSTTPFDSATDLNTSLWYLDTTEAGANYSITRSPTGLIYAFVYDVRGAQTALAANAVSSKAASSTNPLSMSLTVPENALVLVTAQCFFQSGSSVSVTASTGPALTLTTNSYLTSRFTSEWALGGVHRSPVRGGNTYTFSYSPSTTSRAKAMSIAAWI